MFSCNRCKICISENSMSDSAKLSCECEGLFFSQHITTIIVCNYPSIHPSFWDNGSLGSRQSSLCSICISLWLCVSIGHHFGFLCGRFESLGFFDWHFAGEACGAHSKIMLPSIFTPALTADKGFSGHSSWRSALPGLYLWKHLSATWVVIWDYILRLAGA